MIEILGALQWSPIQPVGLDTLMLTIRRVANVQNEGSDWFAMIDPDGQGSVGMA